MKLPSIRDLKTLNVTYISHVVAVHTREGHFLVRLNKSFGSTRDRPNPVPFPFLIVIAAAWLALGIPQVLARESATNDAAAGVAQFKKLSVEELMSVEIPTVYGASKRQQKVTEAPSAVTIVNSDEIKKNGYRTLADILRSVRGFYVTYDRDYSYIGVRGFNRPGDFGGRVLVTVDGHRINEPVYDQAFNGTEGVIDVDLIDRVEVIRGPGSSLYGNNAFFAVVNIVTRRGRDLNGAEASAAVASYDTYTGRVTYGKKFENGVEVLFSGSDLDSRGHDHLYFPENVAVNNGVAEGLDGTWAKRAFTTISYRDFSLQGAFVDRRKDIPTGAYGNLFNTPGDFTVDERAYADLKYEHQFEHDLGVLARVYYDHYRFDGHYPFDYNPGQVTINRDLIQAESIGTEVQLGKLLFEKHRLTGGVEYKHDLQLSLRNFDEQPYANYLEANKTADTVGVYAQDEFALLSRLTLNAGVRYDYFSSFGDEVNPRAALIYNPVDPTVLKFVYGQAFRAPNANELYYVAPTDKANPSLRSESIRSYELIWEQGINRHFRLNNSLFLNQIDNLINQVQDPNDGLFFYSNQESVESRGFETEMEGTWSNSLRARASYTYQETRDTTTGRILSNSPRHLAKFNLNMPLYRDKLFAGIEVQGMSHRLTVNGNDSSGFWLVNATLFSREIVKGLELSASVYNLFDHHYNDPASIDFTQDTIPQDGRNFRVKFTYRF